MRDLDVLGAKRPRGVFAVDVERPEQLAVKRERHGQNGGETLGADQLPVAERVRAQVGDPVRVRASVGGLGRAQRYSLPGGVILGEAVVGADDERVLPLVAQHQRSRIRRLELSRRPNRLAQAVIEVERPVDLAHRGVQAAKSLLVRHPGWLPRHTPCHR